MGILILLSPFFVHRLPNQEQGQGRQAGGDDFYVQNFDYDHWQSAGSKPIKDYTLSGKILSLENKPFGPFQIALWKEIVLDHPRVSFYANGQTFAQLTAGQGLPQGRERMDFINNNITFTDGPVLANVRGHVLTCSTLIWDKTSNAFKGEGHCRLQLEDKAVQAPVIIVDKDLMAWHIPASVL